MKIKNYLEAEKLVNNYPTKYKEGFTRNEIYQFVKDNNLDLEDFLTKLGVNTGMLIGREAVTYSCDILTAFICTLENREQNLFEFD